MSIPDDRPAPVRPDDVGDLTREARVALDGMLGSIEALTASLDGAPPDVLDDVGRIRAASRRVRSLVSRLEHQIDTARADAERDPLTGVANRRALEVHAAALLASGGVLSLLLVDLDRFKQVNDTFGHVVGDEVLKAVVERCRRAVRDGDMVARFAGDEFVVLLPGASEAVAARIAARVARNVSAEPVVTHRGPVTVRASVGVATRREGDRTLERLLDRADGAMYAVKRTTPPDSADMA